MTCSSCVAVEAPLRGTKVVKEVGAERERRTEGASGWGGKEVSGGGGGGVGVGRRAVRGARCVVCGVWCVCVCVYECMSVFVYECV